MDGAMDLTAFKLMLESQERSFKLSLDTVVKEMHDQMCKLENRVTELTTSLEYTQREVDDLKSKIKDQDVERKEDKGKIESLTKHIDTLSLKVKELEDKVVYQEDYNRRKNLRITGLVEQVNETWEQTSAAVTSLFESKLQMPGVALERAHRVGPRRDSKPRTIVARFTSYGDRDAALRRGRNLKGTNIYLNEDLSATSQAIKNAQMPMYKQARADGKVAFFRHTKLIIRERLNHVDTDREQPSMDVAGSVGGDVPGAALSGSEPVTGTTDTAVGVGSAATAVGVVNVESAGVWTGRDNKKRSSFSSQPGTSRRPSASPVPSQSRHTEGKRDLRSNKRN